jgi:hypothetical protein
MSPLRSITLAISLQFLAVAHRARRTPAKSEVHAKARPFARNGDRLLSVHIKLFAELPIPSYHIIAGRFL